MFSTLERLRQEECFKFEANLDYFKDTKVDVGKQRDTYCSEITQLSLNHQFNVN